MAWALGAATGAGAQTGTGAQGATPAGTYLAARAAEAAKDLPAVADLYARALGQDPANARFLQSALLADFALGRLPEARALADRLVAAGEPSAVAALARAVTAAQADDWRAILRDLEAGRRVGPIADGLARGWAWMGEGETGKALAAFDELASTPSLKPFALYHKGLALALLGDLDGARAAFALADSEGVQRTRRAVLAEAEVLGALGRRDEALRLIDEVAGKSPDALLAALRVRLQGDAPVAFDLIASPAEGLAEAYLNLAAVVAGDDPTNGVILARAALALDPDEADAALLAGQLLADLGQPDLAREAFASVPSDDPDALAAELGRASVLRSQGEDEAALEVLSRLAQDHPDLPEVQATLGDLLRGMDRPQDAEAAYGRAIDLSPADAGNLWYLHFTRALARQAQDDWPDAEADLRRSLQLRPDQPQALNHLGYTLVDRGEKLDEALDLIRKAVALRPDDGAIVDSLGWAYYRLARYPEAVEQLEKAATLVATDPVVNDHLGDAYWRVGREREARFQWSRALSFDPEPDEAETLHRKLAKGLDAADPPKETAALPPESTGG
ncbi:tetratricopeptide repeat protein [Rubellimicrobium mesophilum]|nr:tetratricopeptide repeat protein [Rubellimicrobium mesophilum]